MSTSFSNENGDLIIKEILNDQITWKGKPLGYDIENLLKHPQKEVCFVLFSRKDGPRLYLGGPPKAFNNLACIDLHGSPLWIADLPASGVDFYTNVIWAKDLQTEIFKIDLNLKEKTLAAFSYSGYLVNINPENGKIIDK